LYKYHNQGNDAIKELTLPDLTLPCQMFHETHQVFEKPRGSFDSESFQKPGTGGLGHIN
jgi:hypothetical protein